MNETTRNTIGGAAFLVIGAAALYAGADLEMGSLLVPGPGALPKMALLAICALSAVLLLSGRRQAPAFEPEGRAEEAPPEMADPGAYTKVATTIAAILAFVLALPAFGFLLSSAVLMAVLAGLGAEKQWSIPAMLGGLITAVAAYLLFAKALGVPLPAGSFWGA